MKKFVSILSILLICTMLLSLAACGSSDQQPESNAAAQPSGAAEQPSASQEAEAPAQTGDYTFRTSADNKVVTENGTFTKDNAPAPVLVTSFGQSADVSMLDALMKKAGADYTFDATATAEDAANYNTIIIACGASSKGLGAAGISQEDETARAEAILQAVSGTDTVVIAAHLGGAARRGTLSDQFNDMALSVASYIIVVEEGNEDGKFTDAASDKGIPITLLNSISDAVTPLTDLFGA